MAKNWLEVRTEFFRPMWRRVVAVALVGAWTLVEISGGSIFWTILFGASTLYLAWAFFIAFDDRPDPDG